MKQYHMPLDFLIYLFCIRTSYHLGKQQQVQKNDDKKYDNRNKVCHVKMYRPVAAWYRSQYGKYFASNSYLTIYFGNFQAGDISAIYIEPIKYFR